MQAPLCNTISGQTLIRGGPDEQAKIESLMRRDISLPIKERIYQAAFAFLVLFAAVVIYTMREAVSNAPD